MNSHGGNVWDFKDPPLLDYSSNINPLGIPDSFRKAMLQYMEEFTRYPDLQYREVKQSVRRYLYPGSAEPDVSVVLGNGSAEIFYKAMTWPSITDVVISVPTFNEYARAASFAGKPCTAVPLKEDEEFRPNLSALLPYIKQGTLCLLCNPDTPTGQLLPGSDLRPFLDELQRIGAYLMVDECFIEFSCQSLAQSMVGAVPSHPNLMIVRAATKFFGMPGLRLGYGVTSNGAWAQAVEAKMEPWHINAAAVTASRCIFQDLPYIEKTRRWFETERPSFLSGLRRWDSVHVYPGHACFFLLRAEDTAAAERIYTELLQEGILIRRAEGFENLSARHFRVALKDARSNAHFIGAIQKRGL